MKPGHTDVTVSENNSPEIVVGHATDQCRAVGSILARIGDKWSVLVVMSLGDRTFRFNELKRHINGISQRMLTLTLRGLERDGLVERTFFPTIPEPVAQSPLVTLKLCVSVLTGLVKHDSIVALSRHGPRDGASFSGTGTTSGLPASG